MSFRRALWAFAIAVCLVAPAAVHAQGDYLDVFIVKVKPEKIAEFQALTKKWIDANRRFNGDHWLALETVYGEGNVYQFTSIRKDYAEIDKMNDAVMAAVNKAFGKEAAQKMGQDFDNCLVSSRSELRLRRWDLSRKAPKDPDAYAKLIGESRLLRTVAVHVRSGHTPEFEALLKEMKEAGEKNPDTQPVFVSQMIEGGKGTVFYVSTLRSSMAGFDHKKARNAFNVPADYDIGAVTALGYLGDPNTLHDRLYAQETSPRQRRPLSEFVLTDWDKPAL